MIRTTVYLPIEVHADLGRLSTAWWMSVSQLVRLAVDHAFRLQFDELRAARGIVTDLESRRRRVDPYYEPPAAPRSEHNESGPSGTEPTAS